MRCKSLLTVVAWSATVACSDAAEPLQAGDTPGKSSDGAAFFPADLDVSAKPGGNGGLSVTALTLRRGPTHGELYAALLNDGSTPACSPSFSVDLLDATEQPLGTGIGGLLVQRFYRLTDGSDTIAACVDPGDVAMVAITDLPAELLVEDVARVVYWLNYWVLELVPIAGISFVDLRAVSDETGTAYAGQLVNGFDVSLSRPSVAVFPLNDRGRPLGVVYGHASVEVPPGGSWNFVTDSVKDAGTDQAAYPTGGP
jgi:hypothetical protein